MSLFFIKVQLDCAETRLSFLNLRNNWKYVLCEIDEVAISIVKEDPFLSTKEEFIDDFLHYTIFHHPCPSEVG